MKCMSFPGNHRPCDPCNVGPAGLLWRPVAADIAAMETEPPTVTAPKRKCRWFQFRLRTLMTGVTLLAMACGFVGWQASVVRERQAMLCRLCDLNGACFTGSDYRAFAPCVWLGWNADRVPSFSWDRDPQDLKGVIMVSHAGGSNRSVPELPWLRKWLGDDAIIDIYIPDSVGELDVAEIVRAFPESTLSRKLGVRENLPGAFPARLR
jgi:hypothetical protein